jgi:hypothetical protein
MREILDNLNGVLSRTLLSLESSCGNSLFTDVSSTPPLPRGNFDAPRGSFDVQFGGTALSLESTDLGGGSLPLPSSNYGSTIGHSYSNSNGSISAFGAVPLAAVGEETNRQMMYDLLCASFDSIPRIVPSSGITFIKLVELFSRFIVHVDLLVRSSVYEALMRLARLDDDCVKGGGFWDVKVDGYSPGVFARVIVGVYGEYCINLCNELYTDIVVGMIATSTESWESSPYYNSLQTFIGVCEIWIERLEKGSEGSVTIERSEITRIADGIECFGLLNLCFSLPGVRKEGIVILGLAERLEKVLIEKRRDEFNDRGAGIVEDLGELSKRSRVLRIIENCGPGLVKRFGKSKSMKGSEIHPSLLEIAISDSDQALWMRCFSVLVSDILEYGHLNAVNSCLFSILVCSYLILCT